MNRIGIPKFFFENDESYKATAEDYPLVEPFLFNKLSKQVISEINKYRSKYGEFPSTVFIDTEKYTYICKVNEDYSITNISKRYDKRTEAPKETEGDGDFGENGVKSLASSKSQGSEHREVVGGTSNGIGRQDGVYNADNADSVQDSGKERVNIYAGSPLIDSKYKIFGWTAYGKVFLTTNGINAETPIHEYTHLWCIAMQQNNPVGWSSVVENLKGCKTWNDVVKDMYYSNIYWYGLLFVIDAVPLGRNIHIAMEKIWSEISEELRYGVDDFEIKARVFFLVDSDVTGS